MIKPIYRIQHFQWSKKIYPNYIYYIVHLWQLEFSCEICFIDIEE